MFESPPFHLARPDLVRPVGVDRKGERGPTPGQSRGPKWRVSSRGLFVPANVERTTEQRIVEAAAVLRDGEAVTGWASFCWRGDRWFDGEPPAGPLDVPISTTRHVWEQRGFRVSQEFVRPDDIEVVDGLAITTPVRSVTFMMRYAARPVEAVEAIDMACYNDRVSLDEVDQYLGEQGPLTGIQQARDAVLLASENSWSPRETRMRCIWTMHAGLSRPLCNAPVFDLEGRHVGTPDLVDPELGLVGQYHGADHLSLAGATDDVQKDAAYRDLGLETVIMLATDWRDTSDFLARLHAAADRARNRVGPPRWTVVAPQWWVRTHTVARRRALNAEQKARFLNYRRSA